MIRVLFAFAILAISVFLGTQLTYDPGYVLVTINHWSMETTLWVALFGLILLFLLIHALLQVCSTLGKTPEYVHEWNTRRLAHKAQAITRKGLIEYNEGYWQKAQGHLMQAVPHNEAPLLNYLTAARAAQKLGDSPLRDHYLHEAQQSVPEARIAIALTQAQLQLANRQWEQALATLKHLHEIVPHHPFVLKLLMELYKEIHDWPQLIALLPELKKHHIVSDSVFNSIQKEAYVGTLTDLVRKNQSDAATAFFHSAPKKLATHPDLVAAYVLLLIKNQDYHAAENILKRCLRKNFDPKLIALYGQIHTNTNQLAFAESFLKKEPHSADLYLCLGRLCKADSLWGKAKNYLEHALEIKPTAQAYFALGTLYEQQLNEPSTACLHFKKGLELTLKETTQES